MLCAAMLLVVDTADSASLSVSVGDDQGNPVENAVVSLYAPRLPSEPGKIPQGVMDQRDRQFVPHVLAVRTGTAVRFPNSDDIRHHVYSFSAPKQFEIRLYHGTPSEPIVFDKPGVVALGCNIHDWMIGYIYVADTPYFARTSADAKVSFKQVPAGDYQLRVWHPWLPPEQLEVSRDIKLTNAESLQAKFELKLIKPEIMSQEPPSLLRDKFRRFGSEDS